VHVTCQIKNTTLYKAKFKTVCPPHWGRKPDNLTSIVRTITLAWP